MAYPEPNSLDDLYGAGAEAADAFAEDLDLVTHRAVQAGVSYRTILSVISALADAAAADAIARAPEPPYPAWEWELEAHTFPASAAPSDQDPPKP